MVATTKTPSSWAYAYVITPPIPEDRVPQIAAVLEAANAAAVKATHTWRGNYVVEPQITHILVVSDSPTLDHDINRSLESGLKKLKIGYTITTPMALEDDAPPLGASAVVTTPPTGGAAE
jgi:hypothetical protein